MNFSTEQIARRGIITASGNFLSIETRVDGGVLLSHRKK